MTEKKSYLFVYGTLLQKGNKFAIYLGENSSFYGKGTVKGKLFDAGEYPGLVLQPSDGFVYGNIYALTNPEATLKVLDDYEGYGEHYAQPNEFIREITAVETSGKSLKCWVYVYNLNVDGLEHITSGNYQEYKKF